MKTIHLQVQEDYLDEFLSLLPHDKVKLLREDYADLQKKFQQALESFNNSDDTFIPYHEKMKEIDVWIKEGENR